MNAQRSLGGMRTTANISNDESRKTTHIRTGLVLRALDARETLF